MKRKIFTIGESVYDIIFKDGKIVSGKAGGSMLNASVSLGRAGADVAFITEIGDDKLGENILLFLEENKVDTSFVEIFHQGKTPVALAFLDENQNAGYSFYKQYPDQRLKQKFPAVNENDIVLFGSFFAVNPEVRKRVLEFVGGAKKAGAIIVYDPNIRHPKSHDLKNILESVQENFALADLIRASHEDFKVLFHYDEPEVASEIVAEFSDAHLLYTQASDFVLHARENHSVYYKVPQIEVVSSIGAGDNFNAGIIYALLKNNVHRNALTNVDDDTWHKIIRSGIGFSQQVCKSYENYIPKDFFYNG
ncbi:MAG: carbohydrate kinase [Bacteroidales bacterium]|nr:carbohydrate kinase [Bacteroidales bacterium]